MYYIKYTPRLFEVIIDVTDRKIIHHKEMPRTQFAPVDRLELNEAAAVALKDPLVTREIERLQLGDNVVVVDPWDYGRDNADDLRRLTQIFFYTRNPKNNSPDSNHYAFPLDFMAIVDLCTMKVTKICHLPLGAEAVTSQHTGPRKVGNPLEPEYDHNLQSHPARITLRPLQVVQPEGASFTLTGRVVEWEKWRFRVGFNWREVSAFVLERSLTCTRAWCCTMSRLTDVQCSTVCRSPRCSCPTATHETRCTARERLTLATSVQESQPTTWPWDVTAWVSLPILMAM
jgi:primary-amine oxidase